MVAVWLLTWPVSLAVAPADAPPRPANGAVVARLVDALKDPDLEVRLSLGAALSKFPAEAVGPLAEALTDADPARRAGAAYALGLLGPRAEVALGPLLKALDDPELEVRRQAAQAVSRVVTNTPRPRTPLVLRP